MEMTHKKAAPDYGEGGGGAVGRGKREQKRKKSFLRNGTKYLPVILERSEESRQRIQVLNTLFAINLCRILRYHSSRSGSVMLIRILPPLKNDGRSELRFFR